MQGGVDRAPMNIMHCPRGSALALLLALALGASAFPAQAAERWRVAQQDPDGQPVEETGEASAMVVRLGRLENQIRSLTGQIEQLQFQNKRLEDSLRKLGQDVDFRFQDLQGRGGAGAPARPPAPQKRGDADPGAPGPGLADEPAPPAASVAPAPVRAAGASGDAFDPDADPAAPGAPKPLGTTAPSAPLPTRAARLAGSAGNAPLDLMQHGVAGQLDDPARASAPAVIPAPAAAREAPNPNAVASLAPGGTRDEYDADLGLYKQGQFDGAATGFQAFAEKYPKDRLVPDAVYLAGESYARLGRHREAAEQFLKVSTDYGKSPRAPDALLRLGMSLNALGAKEQACATYQEVGRRYPAASADVRSAVDRELKRARCIGSG